MYITVINPKLPNVTKNGYILQKQQRYEFVFDDHDDGDDGFQYLQCKA